MSEAIPEIQVLREELNELQRRVDKLENKVQSGSNDSDRRDAAVLSALETGETYSAGEIKSIYRTETDIRNERTLTQRLKALVATDAFENTRRHGIWRYVGETDE